MIVFDSQRRKDGELAGMLTWATVNHLWAVLANWRIPSLLEVSSMILEVFSNLNVSVAISNQSRAWCGAQGGSGTLTFGPLAICSELSELFDSAACYRLYKWRSKSEGSLSLWGSREDLKREEKRGKERAARGIRAHHGPCTALAALPAAQQWCSHTWVLSFMSVLCAALFMSPLKQKYLKKSKGQWLIELERFSAAKISSLPFIGMGSQRRIPM